MIFSQSKCMIDSSSPPSALNGLDWTCCGPKTWTLWCSPRFSRFIDFDQPPSKTVSLMLPLAVLWENKAWWVKLVVVKFICSHTSTSDTQTEIHSMPEPVAVFACMLFLGEHLLQCHDISLSDKFRKLESNCWDNRNLWLIPKASLPYLPVQVERFTLEQTFSGLENLKMEWHDSTKCWKETP